MNSWLMATCGVGACLIPCAVVCLRGKPEWRLVGFEMTGIIVAILMALFVAGTNRLAFMDLPLSQALLSFGGGLVFARFLEKHL
ncbi:MAG TPA: monovalent cation/H+ antiporter complex subunit F [Candidatus Angelobacter sp.]|nr:monovalent cation/H+ antiporter complex subunit F [Candidatus Angelobacter sp.]